MNRRGALLALVLWSGTIEAAKVRVRLDSAHAGCREAVIAAEPENGKRLTTRAGPEQQSHVFALADGQAWMISAEAANCWSDRAIWSASDSGDLVLRAYPAATLAGRLEGPGARGVKNVRGFVSVHDPDRQADAHDLPPATTSNSSCTIAAGEQWRCTVPADAAFDFRIDIPGFAAQYFWDLAVLPGAAYDVEPQPLTAGSSITGWVVDPRDAPIANARVSVVPETAPSRERDRAATVQTIRTNRRGFFQFTGLPPASYRIVSHAAGLSPAVVPQITTRGGDTVSLPRPVRHSRPVELEVLIEPPVDRSGAPWTVELTETAPLLGGQPPKTIQRRAGQNGRWTANNLRADAYQLMIRDGGGGLAHRAEVDLFDGGPGTIDVTVAQIVLRGLVRAGEEPLAAGVRLWNRGGHTVEALSDAEGRFEVVLPSTGTWQPTVLVPPGPAAAGITAAPFEIPEEARGDAPHEIVVQLAGGRIRGKAVTAEQKTGATMVHAFRGTQRAAQQETGDDGQFDFVGLEPGTYRLDARTAHSMTPQPVDIVIEEDESRDVTLVMEPYARLSGYVVTPDGRPASGAVIKVSSDGGASWQRMVTDVRGHFERRVRGGAQMVQLVVLAYGYPAAMLAAPLTNEPVRVQLRPDGGVVRFRSLATIIARGVHAPAHIFRFRSDGPFDGTVHLEGGVYMVCPVNAPQEQCRSLTVTPSTRDDVDFSPKPSQPSTGATS